MRDSSATIGARCSVIRSIASIGDMDETKQFAKLWAVDTGPVCDDHCDGAGGCAGGHPGSR